MFVDQCKELYLTTEKSDVTLIIDDTVLPAHRFVLSERSEYFKTMFSSSFVEANSNKIILKETNLKAFQRVLDYIYIDSLGYLQSSEIPMNDLFEVLACARFYMVDGLSSEMISIIKKTKSDQICLLLNNAFAYAIDELVVYCTDMIKKGKCPPISLTFDDLSPMTVDYILQLRLDTTESEILEELACWMRQNPQYLSSFSKLLEHIDLYLLEKEQLEKLFKPIELVGRTIVHDLLCQQHEHAKIVKKVVNCNVINAFNDLRIVEGYKVWVEQLDEICLASSKKNFIIIDLKQQFLINCLKLKLDYDALYTVSVSKDMRDWEQVIDFSKYECSGQQLLYFNERAVRFIRVQNVAVFNFLLDADIEALYSTDPFEINLASTITIPNQNVVPSEMSYQFISNTGDGFIRGVLFSECVEHLIGNKHGIIFQFKQPYVVGSIKLLLNDTSSYYISISTNKKCFTRVLAEENVTGWRVVTFPKQPVMFIKIVGTKAPSLIFQLYKLECPAI